MNTYNRANALSVFDDKLAYTFRVMTGKTRGQGNEYRFTCRFTEGKRDGVNEPGRTRSATPIEIVADGKSSTGRKAKSILARQVAVDTVRASRTRSSGSSPVAAPTRSSATPRASARCSGLAGCLTGSRGRPPTPDHATSRRSPTTSDRARGRFRRALRREGHCLPRRCRNRLPQAREVSAMKTSNMLLVALLGGAAAVAGCAPTSEDARRLRRSGAHREVPGRRRRLRRPGPDGSSRDDERHHGRRPREAEAREGPVRRRPGEAAAETDATKKAALVAEAQKVGAELKRLATELGAPEADELKSALAKDADTAAAEAKQIEDAKQAGKPAPTFARRPADTSRRTTTSTRSTRSPVSAPTRRASSPPASARSTR